MAAPRRFEETHTFHLPKRLVWSVLSDTERINQTVGLGVVNYGEAREDHGAIYREATSKIAGVTLHWREYPFNWDQANGYSVVRIYHGGPVERFEGGATLEEKGPLETVVKVWAEVTGRRWVIAPIVGTVAKQFVVRTLEAVSAALGDGALGDEALADRACIAVSGPSSANTPVLERMAASLRSRPVLSSYVDALCKLLLGASDGDVATIRPFEWAAREGLDRDEALRTCLHAVKTGMLNLRWALMCPNCRVSKAEAATLGDVGEGVHCDLCGVSFSLNFDRYVELRFAVHPAIRMATRAVHCLTGPARSPHILIQKSVRPGVTEPFAVSQIQEPLRLRVLRLNQTVEIMPDGVHSPQLRYTENGWDTLQTLGCCTVRNDTENEITVVMEKVNWDDSAVTAARVMALQEFRDMFSSEVLKPGREIGVESLTLFFSDLGNSTALYERIGDAPAFYRVGECFEFLIGHIAAHRGALVKTIGDAVMAVFLSPEDALEAAIAMQRHFDAFRSSHGGLHDVYLKIGLHHGPALAVTQNDRLDYFGRTVNIAARVSSASRGCDIAFTSGIYDNDAVLLLLGQQNLPLSTFSSSFRGLAEELSIYRLDFH